MPRISAISPTFFFTAPWHALDIQRVADVLAHIHMRIKREHLKHERNIALAARAFDRLLRRRYKSHLTWAVQARHHSQRRRFAAARGTEQHEELAVFNREAGRLHRIERPEILAHIFNTYLCHGLLRKMADDDEHHRANKGDNEGIAVEPERKGCISMTTPNAIRIDASISQGPRRNRSRPLIKVHHLRTAPNVIPRSRCLRKQDGEDHDRHEEDRGPAATAGQSLPLVRR